MHWLPHSIPTIIAHHCTATLSMSLPLPDTTLMPMQLSFSLMAPMRLSGSLPPMSVQWLSSCIFAQRLIFPRYSSHLSLHCLHLQNWSILMRALVGSHCSTGQITVLNDSNWITMERRCILLHWITYVLVMFLYNYRLSSVTCLPMSLSIDAFVFFPYFFSPPCTLSFLHSFFLKFSSFPLLPLNLHPFPPTPHSPTYHSRPDDATDAVCSNHGSSSTLTFMVNYFNYLLPYN